MACCGVPLPFCAFLLLLLNAAFQTSDAIPCQRVESSNVFGDTSYITVECEKTCVSYWCDKIRNVGCSSDFYRDCQGSDSAIAFVKSKTPEKLVYNDNYVTYISGCENTKCLDAKQNVLDKEFQKRMLTRTPSPENPLWYYETPGDVPEDERKDFQCDYSLRIAGESESDVATYKVGCPFCTLYECGKKKGYGCPADFKVNCADYPKSIAFIQSKTPKQLNYHDGTVEYISGCNDGKECLDDKDKVLQAEKEKHHPTLDNPVWYYDTPGDVPQQEQSDNATTTAPVLDPKEAEVDANSQEAAFKVAGMMMAFLGLIFAQFY